MKELIDKTTVVAEIGNCYNECLKRAEIVDADYWNAKADAYRNVLTILDDTLEVKEVDINKEISQFIDANFEKAYRRIINDTATEILIDVQKKSWDIYDDIHRELLTALHQKIGAILENQNTQNQ